MIEDKNKKFISQSYWQNIMDKLIIDKGMELDEAYVWMEKRFTVKSEDLKDEWI